MKDKIKISVQKDISTVDYPVALTSQLRQLLRSVRKTRGWTQADLAQRLGVVQSRVAAIERNPGVVNVEQLLHILALLGAQLVVRDNQLAGAAGQTRAVASPEAPATPQPTAGPAKGQW